MSGSINEKITLQKEIVIRQYGLLQPTDWSEDCDEELHKMNKLWNRLVDIHEDYVRKYYAVIIEDNSLRQAKADFEMLNEISPKSQLAIEAKRQLALLQRDAQKKMAPVLKNLEISRRREVKVARQESELWWGNYNAVVRAFEAGRRTAVRTGNHMHRRSGSDTGRFTNQLIGGASLARVFDGSLSQIFVRLPDEGAWNGSRRGERKRLQRTTLTATVFVRDSRRRNVSWPMIMHRPIPDDCILKEVIITRRTITGKSKWSATFVCSRSIGMSVISNDDTSPTAIDLGWRIVPEGLRVATVLQFQSDPKFIVIDRNLIESFAFVNELKRNFASSASEGMRILIKHFTDGVSEELQTIIKSLRVDLLDGHQPFKDIIGDAINLEINADLLNEISNWRLKHRKLAFWIVNQQRKVIARRNYFYQNAAAEIARSSSFILINSLNLGKISRRVPISYGKFFPQQARYYRTVAAISELLRWIEIQCAKHDVDVQKHKLPSPIPCPECRSLVRTNRADALIQVCTACNASWDQDVGACQYLIDIHQNSKLL